MKKLANGYGIDRPCGWRWWSVVVSVFASLCQVQGQGTLRGITFDGAPAFVGSVLVNQYNESGLSFTAITNQQGYGGFARIQDRWFDYPYNGTAYIQPYAPSPIEVTSADGSLFGLFSVDLAENSRTTPDSLTVQFIGYRADGRTVTTSFTTDGIIGIPGTPDFQTFYFGQEFSSGLTRVEIPPVYASMDNLVVSVPEPGMWALLLLGGVLGYRFLKRQRKTVRN